jgi:hypothetical protein
MKIAAASGLGLWCLTPLSTIFHAVSGLLKTVLVFCKVIGIL